jgi:hypothetical protein
MAEAVAEVQEKLEEMAVEDEELTLDLGKKKKKKSKKVEVRGVAGGPPWRPSDGFGSSVRPRCAAAPPPLGLGPGEAHLTAPCCE